MQVITQQESQMQEWLEVDFYPPCHEPVHLGCWKPQQSLKIVFEAIVMRQKPNMFPFFFDKCISDRDIVPLSNVFTPLKNVWSQWFKLYELPLMTFCMRLHSIAENTVCTSNRMLFIHTDKGRNPWNPAAHYLCQLPRYWVIDKEVTYSQELQEEFNK